MAKIVGFGLLVSVTIIISLLVYTQYQDCKSDGGVLVRTVFGYECIMLKGSV
jgi:hypothetical protein